MFVYTRFKPNPNTFNLTEYSSSPSSYNSSRAQNEKHVVVVATMLNADIIRDFLNEFYSHSKLQVQTADGAVAKISDSHRDDNKC